MGLDARNDAGRKADSLLPFAIEREGERSRANDMPRTQ